MTLHPQPICLQTYPAGNKHFHTDISFAFEAPDPPRHQIFDGESDEIKLLTRNELSALPGDEIFQNVREVAQYVFDTVRTEWKRVDIKL